jgi:hypothetical protein
VPRRIDAGEVLAAIGGVLVFVSLYLNWFEEASGFESFETLDLVIAVLAVAVIWNAVASTLALSSAPAARALPLFGLAILLIVAVQLIDPPPGAAALTLDTRGGDIEFGALDPDREVGGWLALAGGALVLLGGALRLARISVTVSVGERDTRRRVPAVDRRPAASEPAAPAAPPGPDPDATQPLRPTEDR